MGLLSYAVYYSLVSSYATLDFHSKLHAMIERSQRRNLQNALTGALFTDGVLFVQILEGSPPQLEETLRRIHVDRLHSDMTLIEAAGCDARHFDDWALYLGSLDNFMRDQVSAHRSEGGPVFSLDAVATSASQPAARSGPVADLVRSLRAEKR